MLAGELTDVAEKTCHAHAALLGPGALAGELQLAIDLAWRRNDAGKEGDLALVELPGLLVEVVLRRLADAKNAVAPFNDVQVDLEQAPLRHARLERRRHDRFFHFARQ